MDDSGWPHFLLIFAAACLAPAFAISFTATLCMRHFAPKIGLIDRPAARKVHTTPTPLGGGIGIWLGVVVPLAVAQLAAWFLVQNQASLEKSEWFSRLVPEELAKHLEGVLYRADQMWAIVAGGTILATMGLIDDLKNLPWLPRLIVQASVATALAAAGVRATVFVPVPWVSWVLTVLWMLVLVNSFNFLDNMDGLSSGIALIAASLFAAVMLTATGEPRWLVGGVLLVLAGSLAGFLCHNWPPARIFMGDSGSYFIGLLLSSMTVLGTFYHEDIGSRHVMLAPLCILAIPLYDFTSVMVIRLSQRRSPFQPDKSHFSHRLVELGLKPRNAVLTIHLATLTTGLGALLLYRIPDWSGALLVVALIACVLAIVAILETAGRRKNAK
jgi:UDP-GlcNAc:undecaprenyl-phosphate GlcNAc-1-phosphate transferase